jgi:hypothetical protein
MRNKVLPESSKIERRIKSRMHRHVDKVVAYCRDGIGLAINLAGENNRLRRYWQIIQPRVVCALGSA